MTQIPKHEFAGAREWRESHNLTPRQLGDLLGWSVTAIWFFENGATPAAKNPAHDRSIKWYTWLRYRRACQGLDAELRTRRKFEWGNE